MQGGGFSSLSRDLLPTNSKRHQGERRTNWELALHLGQLINWIMGNLRPQANPKEAPLPSLVYCENIRHKDMRPRFHSVFQELRILK